MKKRLKWLFIGSLMCLVVGSVFHQGYGMMNGYKPSWKQKALEARISEVELKKVKNGFFTYQQIVKGHKDWNKLCSVSCSKDVTDEEKLTLLKDAAENGCVAAIDHLLEAYLNGWYRHDEQGLEFAQKHADLGSEEAIAQLLYANEYGCCGLQKNDPKGLVLAQKYADKGSENAIWHLLNAYQQGLFGLQENDRKGLVLAQKYADQGSRAALELLRN